MVSEVGILEQIPADVPSYINTDRVVCEHWGCNSDTWSGLKTPLCLLPGNTVRFASPLPGSLGFLLSVLQGHCHCLLPDSSSASLCLSDSLCSLCLCLCLSLSVCLPCSLSSILYILVDMLSDCVLEVVHVSERLRDPTSSRTGSGSGTLVSRTLTPSCCSDTLLCDTSPESPAV